MMDAGFDIAAVIIAILGAVTYDHARFLALEREKAVLRHEQIMKYGVVEVRLPNDPDSEVTELAQQSCIQCGTVFKTAQNQLIVCLPCRKELLRQGYLRVYHP
jgi:hypothetical protein